MFSSLLVLLAQQSKIIARHNTLNSAFEKRMKVENRRKDVSNINDKRINKVRKKKKPGARNLQKENNDADFSL